MLASSTVENERFPAKNTAEEMGCLGSEFEVRHCVKVSEYANDEPDDSSMNMTKKIKASKLFLEYFIFRY